MLNRLKYEVNTHIHTPEQMLIIKNISKYTGKYLHGQFRKVVYKHIQ